MHGVNAAIDQSRLLAYTRFWSDAAIGMDIDYRDKNLALIETDRATELRLPMSVINALGVKIRFLRNVPDERSLRNWKSLHYEKMEGDERSIRINKKYRLIFTIDTASHPNKITILRVWDHD